MSALDVEVLFHPLACSPLQAQPVFSATYCRCHRLLLPMSWWGGAGGWVWSSDILATLRAVKCHLSKQAGISVEYMLFCPTLGGKMEKEKRHSISRQARFSLPPSASSLVYTFCLLFFLRDTWQENAGCQSAVIARCQHFTFTFYFNSTVSEAILLCRTSVLVINQWWKQKEEFGIAWILLIPQKKMFDL